MENENRDSGDNNSISSNSTSDKSLDISEVIRISLTDESNEDENTSEQSSSSSSSVSNLKYDSSNEENEKTTQKKKKDLLHRDIEKRRRERINKSLVKLKELVPTTRDSMKCNGNSRLQKAKLLEMTVEFLTTMLKQADKSKPSERTTTTTTTITATTNNEKQENKKTPAKVIIAESAKEIYLTGYKAATKHILQKLSDSYHISGSELESLANTIGVINDDISIPNMMLVPPSPVPNRMAAEEKNETKREYIDNNGNMRIPNEGIDEKQDSTDQLYKIVEKNQNKEILQQREEHPPPSSPVFNRKNNKVEENNFTCSTPDPPPPSSVLLSCLIKDPITSQYHTTLLPLESVIPSETYRSLPMSYLHRQSKMATETVMDSTRSREPPRQSTSPRPSYLMKSSAMEALSSEYTGHPLPCPSLKRRYSGDTRGQGAQITSQPAVKRLLNGAVPSVGLYNNGYEHFTGRRNSLSPDSSAAVAALREMSGASSMPTRSEYNNQLIEIVSKEMHSKYANFRNEGVGRPTLNTTNRFSWE